MTGTLILYRRNGPRFGYDKQLEKVSALAQGESKEKSSEAGLRCQHPYKSLTVSHIPCFS